ncbi:MAG: transcriptional repressor [Acidobacteriaceae bacterium]|nr:transcriptional repressor [Acidobacteriaceae bacterium]
MPTSPTFRDVCNAHGIAVTHQRQVLYEVMQKLHGHPSPEEVYAAVKKLIPAISLNTVYKNIHLFIESGVFKELSMHHGTLRVEMNSHDHHHLVCSQCKAVSDIPDAELSRLLGLKAPRKRLSGGFQVQRLAIDVIGLCAKCQTA